MNPLNTVRLEVALYHLNRLYREGIIRFETYRRRHLRLERLS